MSRVLAIRTHSMDKAEEKRVGDIVIESGIPIPPSRLLSNGPVLNALQAMEIGDSFVHRGRLGGRTTGKAIGKKFTQRKIGNGQQFRIWRVK